MTYGEIDFATMAQIFHLLDNEGLEEGGVFMDLGSGSGKVLLSTSILKRFDKLVGIEVL